MKEFGKILGGIFLVSGTAIGAGMLALPINTAIGGFFGASIFLILTWVFMTLSALLVLEVGLTMPNGTNFISMARKTLGLPGQIVTWIMYLALLYALVSTYIQTGSSWFREIIHETLSIQIGRNLGIFLYLVVFATPVFWGTKYVDRLNRFLAVALFIFYCMMIFLAAPTVKIDYLSFGNSSALVRILPLLVTSFGSSIVVPSLIPYLNREVKTLRRVIIIGSVIPIVLYLLWELVVLGNIPMQGVRGLLELMNKTDDGTEVIMALERVSQGSLIKLSSRFFAVFSILTSFLGVSLSLFDFLSDGLNITIKKFKRPLIFLLTYLPPIISLLMFVTGFDQILLFAGAFVSILLGILPALMVWSGRYYTKDKNRPYELMGGKLTLIVIFSFFIYVLCQNYINLFYKT